MDTFLHLYQQLRADNLHLLDTMYDDHITYRDPAHSIQGLPALRSYLAQLYAGVDTIHFSYQAPLTQGNQAYLQWQMHLRHDRLGQGQPITVAGASYLLFAASGKALCHYDYFDLGALLYEQLPLLGRLIRIIKKRMPQ